MTFNGQAAIDSLRLLVGDKGVEMFDMIYATVDAAEVRGRQLGLAVGYEEGYARGATESDERTFRDGWNAGWVAYSEVAAEENEEPTQDDVELFLDNVFGPVNEVIDEDFDEMDDYLTRHKSPDSGYHGV
jgi:hypothetical protein